MGPKNPPSVFTMDAFDPLDFTPDFTSGQLEVSTPPDDLPIDSYGPSVMTGSCIIA